jgi:hypothetical protein
MPRRFSQNLARDIAKQIDEQGADETCAWLEDCIADGDLKPEEFSLREMAHEMVEDGREWVDHMDPRRRGRYHLLEADAVRTTNFSNITGQIVFSTMMKAFKDEAFVFSGIVPTVATRLSGEKIPGIGGIGDHAEVVGEAQLFPIVTLTEDYIETPVTVKRGAILPITREALFFDLTNDLLRQANRIGYWLGVNKEKRVIDAVIDENTTAHRYKRRGVSIGATYGDNSGDHDWDNLEASNALVDWTDIEKAELLLAALTDPNTGEPVMFEAKHLVVTPQLMHTAGYIANATQISLQAGGFATTGNLWSTVAPNPIPKYQIVSSRLLAARMATDTSWFLGDISAAIQYMENWGIEVTQNDKNSEDDFKRDIVFAVKASERGATATVEPRAMVKSTA